MAKKNKQFNEKNKPQLKQSPAPILGLAMPQWAVFILLAAWAYFVTANYYRVYPFSPDQLNLLFLGQYSNEFSWLAFFKTTFGNITSALVAALVFFAANGLGKPAVKALKIESEEPVEKLVFNTAAGMAVLFAVMLIIGMSGFYYRAVAAVILLGGAAYNIYSLRKSGYKFGGVFKEAGKMPFYVKLLFLSSFVISILGAFTPETFYDALSYHITIPQYWVNTHKIQALWCHHQSFIVSYLHIMYSLALMFGNEISAKSVNLTFALLSFTAIYAVSKRYFSERAGALAALLFYTVPLCLLASTRTGLEYPLAFTELSALFALLKFLNRGSAEGGGFGWLMLAGALAGISIASKYTSGGVALGVTAALAYHYFVTRRKNGAAAASPEVKNQPTTGKAPEEIQVNAKKSVLNKTLTAWLIIVVVAAAMVSPWLIRNKIMTGHPLYPFMFKDNYRGLVFSINGMVTAVNDMPPLKPELKEILLLPWNLTMAKIGQEGFTGAALILLMPLLFFVRRTNKNYRYIVVYIIPYYFFWLAARPYLRYFVPGLAVFCIALGYAAESLSGYARKLLAAALAAAFITNITLAAGIQRYTQDPVGVVTGMVSKLDYLSTQRQTYVSPYYNVACWINDNLPKDARVIVFCDSRGYYIKRDYLPNPMGDYCPLLEYVKKSGTAEGVYEKLKAEHITHILINAAELRRTASYDAIYADAETLSRFDKFWKTHVRLLHFDISDVSVLEKGIYSMKAQNSQWWQRWTSDPWNYVYVYEICDEADAALKPAPLDPLLLKDFYPEKRWNTIKETAETLLKQ